MKTDTLPTVPCDFIPEVRFAVYTDTHNKNENVARAFAALHRLYDGDRAYASVDAVFGLGDFTDIGAESDYKNYTDTLSRCADGKMKIINILGNHEMKNRNAVALFEKYFGYAPNSVTKINGFTFIAFSGSPHVTEWTFGIKDLRWAAKKLVEAEKTAYGKPVFVMQHPHNFATVYGSTVWCSPQTGLIWSGHTSVVNFSGHSHFPMNDPRSINQTSYTNIGVGAMARFELEKHCIVGQHPKGYDTAAQLCIVEADSRGRVKISEYDLNTDTVFNEYFIENVNDRRTFAYTYKNMRAHDTVPVLSENTVVTAEKNACGEWEISFTEAKSSFIIHHYDIKIRNGKGKALLKKTFINPYYITGKGDTVRLNIGACALKKDEVFTADITAVSAYRKKATVKAVSILFR